jgi:hypothetical protein
VLGLAALTALGVGATLLLFPVEFRKSYELGTELSAGALSEVRAPGGALIALGLWMGACCRGAVASRVLGLQLAAAAYLGYGLARLLGLALDGVPPQGLLAASLFELVVGASAAALAVLLRADARGGLTAQRMG